MTLAMEPQASEFWYFGISKDFTSAHPKHFHVTLGDIITLHHLTFFQLRGHATVFGVTCLSSRNSLDADT
jgi:hypothetical protein